MQRLEGHQRLVAQGLGCKSGVMQRRMPNPSVKRTVNGGAGWAGFGKAVPPLPSAYLQR